MNVHEDTVMFSSMLFPKIRPFSGMLFPKNIPLLLVLKTIAAVGFQFLC